MKITRPDSMLRQLTRAPLDKPCEADWNEMRGDDKVRRCDHCERDVYAISAMTELEAELRLLNASDALPCIRYARDVEGNVIHTAELVRSRWAPQRPLQSLAMASAIGVALTVREADAKPKAAAAEQTQCVPYEQPAQSAPAPAPPAAAAPSAGAATRTAPAPPAAPPPPPPVMLGGAPPPLQVQPQFGTLVVKSKTARKIRIGAIELPTPVTGYRLTEGSFTAEITEANKKPRTVKFTITVDKQTTVDLDK